MSCRPLSVVAEPRRWPVVAGVGHLGLSLNHGGPYFGADGGGFIEPWAQTPRPASREKTW